MGMTLDGTWPLRLAAVCLALGVLCVSQGWAAFVLDDFEDGDLAGWTVTGTAWENGPQNGYSGPNQYGTASGQEGLRWVDSWPDDGSNNDGRTGTMTSPAFTLDENTLRMKMSGFGGNGNGPGGDFGANTQIANMTNTWELRRTSDNALLVRGTAPFRDPQFVEVLVDTGGYVGTEVQLVLKDNATGGYGWFGVDYIRTENRDVTSLLTMEIGADQGAWALSAGSSFAYHAVLNNTSDRHAREGGEFLRSRDSGVGTARSPDFVITRATLEFFTAGFGAMDPASPGNRIYLKDAQTDAVLMTFGDDEALGGDNWWGHAVDVSPYGNQQVYLELDDVVNGGYGWVGIDDVRLSGEVVPEPATMALVGLGALGWRRRNG